MNTTELLKQASKYKSEAAARKLLDALTDAFQESKIGHLETANGDFRLEDDGVFVSIEFNREISGDYITMIKPEIRGGKLSVYVATDRMLDGIGMQSQNWKLATAGQAELEDEIEVDEDREISDVAERAAKLAIQHHQRLIEQVGVPDSIAAETARQCWAGSDVDAPSPRP